MPFIVPIKFWALKNAKNLNFSEKNKHFHFFGYKYSDVWNVPANQTSY